MKVAFTARDQGLDAAMDDRFGRAPYFVLVDTQTEAVESEGNPNVAAGSGAGIGSAEFLSRRGVEAVVTNNVGPKAAQALSAAGIAVYAPTGSTVRENLDAFSAGGLSRMDGPNVGEKNGLNRGGFGGGGGRGGSGGRGGRGGGGRRPF